jgi:hypothetical protein
METWAMENGFKLSSSKTVGMHFGNKRGHHVDPELDLSNSPIKMVAKLNILVSFLKVKLSFHLILKCLKIRALKLLIFKNLYPVSTGVWIERLE